MTKAHAKRLIAQTTVLNPINSHCDRVDGFGYDEMPLLPKGHARSAGIASVTSSTVCETAPASEQVQLEP
jgi:hypothetical protein